MSAIIEKRQQATALLAQADTAVTEGDPAKAQQIAAEIKKLLDEADQLEAAATSLKALRGDMNRPANPVPVTSAEAKQYNPTDAGAKTDANYRPALWVKGLGPAIQPKWVRDQMGSALKDEARFYEQTFTKWFRDRSKDASAFFRNASAEEIKAMQENTDSEGGFFVPEDFRTIVLRDPGAPGGVHRPFCSQITTSLKDGFMPTFGSMTWAVIAEEAAYGDNTPTVGQVPFTVSKSGGTVKVSAELLEDSAVNLPSLLAQIGNEAKGRFEDTKIIAGSGSNEPQGLRTVLGANETFTMANATSIVAADVIKLYWALPAQFRNGAIYSFTSSLMSQIETIGSAAAGIHFAGGTEGTYGNAAPIETVRGRRVVTYDGTGWDDATAIASAEVLGCFGDFRQYYLIDRIGMSVRRDDSIYVANDQVGFFMRCRFDGRVGVKNAFRLLKAA